MLYDICIVGAGPSGMAAALSLQEQAPPHTQIVVLEARDRVGGRTLSQRVSVALSDGEEIDATVDLGGQWIGVQHTQSRLLAAKLGLELEEQFCTGKKVLEVDGKVFTSNMDIPMGISIAGLCEMQIVVWRLEWMASRLKYAKDKELEKWDAMSAHAWIEDRTWTEGSK
jgi:monoamine oxidase